MFHGLTLRAFVYTGVLVFSLVAVVGPSSMAQDEAPQVDGGFVDIEGNVHEEDIKYIVSQGVTVACEPNRPRYCPNRLVT